ncbi:hypothetical protein E0G06_06800 [Salmonella enterica]|nr:hypothetical protein [Salmonella enterica]EAU6965818.1 hypothetical protein [Salmonella enterica]
MDKVPGFCLSDKSPAFSVVTSYCAQYLPTPYTFPFVEMNDLNSDVSKSARETLNRILEEIFEETDTWLV